jgi:hypothetical protein
MGACRIGCHLGAGGDESAQKVEHHESNGPHGVFNVVAEHGEKPHVADHVKPAAVHEHGGEGREPVAMSVHDANQVSSDGDLGSRLESSQKLAGNEPEMAHRGGQ